MLSANALLAVQRPPTGYRADLKTLRVLHSLRATPLFAGFTTGANIFTHRLPWTRGVALLTRID
jgi:hypothetical protein